MDNIIVYKKVEVHKNDIKCKQITISQSGS